MKTRLAFAGMLALGVLGFALAGCGSEKAVSLGKPGSGAATTDRARADRHRRSRTLSLEVWFSRDNGLVAVRRTHAPTQLVATAAMNALLDGPTAAERSAGLSSAVPTGTRLLGIAIHDGLATVDLTSEYQSGGGARSRCRRGSARSSTRSRSSRPCRRCASASTASRSTSSRARASCSSTRSAAATTPHLLPAITVDKPAAGARVTSPVTVSGSANVFEANVTVEVLDASGKVVGKTFTTASCGTGCRGTYSVDGDLQGREGAGGHDRRARRRRGRNRHAAALGAGAGHVAPCRATGELGQGLVQA